MDINSDSDKGIYVNNKTDMDINSDLDFGTIMSNTIDIDKKIYVYAQPCVKFSFGVAHNKTLCMQ